MAHGKQDGAPPLARTSDGTTARIEDLIAPALGDMGYEIVRIVFSGRPARLQIMAERQDRRGMTVEDCAEISRAVNALLDVEDPIPGHYHLEVSSPGIDRPLTRLTDFERFAGFEARVEMRQPSDGRRRYSGRLRGLAGTAVRLETAAGEQVELPFEEISKAKLVLTDDLIAASQDQDRGL